MSNARYIARASDVAARRIGEELMIMSPRDSALFSLNETAALLWQAADGVTPLTAIVERELLPVFDVDLPTALADAEQVVAQLAEHRILQVADAPFGDAANGA